jgi:hypothetical protein
MIVLQCWEDVTSLEESIDGGIAHIWDEGVIIMDEKVTFKEIALGELIHSGTVAASAGLTTIGLNG